MGAIRLLQKQILLDNSTCLSRFAILLFLSIILLSIAI